MMAVDGLRDFTFTKTLIDSGARANERNNEGQTPLDILLDGAPEYDRGVKKIVSLLLGSGADTSLMSKDEKPEDNKLPGELSEHGLDPRGTFKEVFARNSPESIASAVQKGFDLNIQDSEGMTFYNAALRYGTSEVVKACIDAGADVDEVWGGSGIIQYRSYPESWPLYAAVDGFNADAVKTLIEVGAEAKVAGRFDWWLRTNIFPEGSDCSEASQMLKKRLDSGSEILKILRDAGAIVPDKDCEGRELTYARVGYNNKNSDKFDVTVREIIIDMTEEGNENGAELTRILRDAGMDAVAFKNDNMTFEKGMDAFHVFSGLSAIFKIEEIDIKPIEAEIVNFLRTAGACPSRDEGGGKCVTALCRAASPGALIPFRNQ
jgi:hypothetical protein